MPSSKSVPAPTPSASTRLENIRFAGDRASCEIDGQAVVLTGERAAPAIQAFQAFYQEAYRSYGLAPEAAENPRGESPPWWQRLRSWLARLIGGAEGPAGPVPAQAASLPLTIAKRSSPKADAPAPEPAKAESAPAMPARSEAAKRESASAESRSGSAETKTRRASPGEAAVGKEPAAPPPPLLMAAFADEKGIHLLWNLTPGVGQDQIKQRSYGFDSKVATRLQDCYSQLSELGYQVTDLKLWQKAPEPAVAPKTADPAARPGGPTERILRLLPADPDHPSRLAVAPIEGDLTPLVLTDTPKKVAALHAAADAAQPPEKRLTFLTCTIGAKGEPKLAEYVTGEDPHDASKRKPIASLEAEAVKTPRAPKPEPRSDPHPAGGQGAAKTTRSTPSPAPAAGGPELEFFSSVT